MRLPPSLPVGVHLVYALELEQPHRELVDAIDNMNCGVVGIDAEGIIVFANDRLLDWLGYEWDELVGESVNRLIPKELDARVHEQLKATSEGDIRARISIAQRKDSTTFPVLLIPHRYKGPEGPFFNVVVELSAIQTAKPIGYDTGAMRARLDRIAFELQTLGLTADVHAPSESAIHHPDLEDLSDREREVLAHLVSGERVPAISKTLHISPHTVRNHLKSIYRQVGVSSQSELIEHVRSLGGSGH